jgi:uncharacterized membrane protein
MLEGMTAVLASQAPAAAPDSAAAGGVCVVTEMDVETDAGPGWTMEWTLKRHCAMTPRQMLGCYGFVCALSLLVAGGFWSQGVTMVLPFASLELLALGVALLLYARHAGDRDRIVLNRRGLVVERSCGAKVERVEFLPEWVRVEPLAGDQSLIELSGQGRCITVGRLVRPELRRQLAQELRLALRRTRWPEAAPTAARA